MAAILKGRTTANVIRVRKAVDCGTQELNSASKTFEDLCKDVGNGMDST
jgi:hypothetical protein